VRVLRTLRESTRTYKPLPFNLQANQIEGEKPKPNRKEERA
jgi:hypothetical protein